MASQDLSNKPDFVPSKLGKFFVGLLQPGALTISVLGLCFVAIVICKILSPETKDATLLAAFGGLLIRSFFGIRA